MKHTLDKAGTILQWCAIIAGWVVLGYTVGAVLWFFITLK